MPANFNVHSPTSASTMRISARTELESVASAFLHEHSVHQSSEHGMREQELIRNGIVTRDFAYEEANETPTERTQAAFEEDAANGSEPEAFPAFEYTEADRRAIAAAVADTLALRQVLREHRLGSLRIRAWFADARREARNGATWHRARRPTPHPLVRRSRETCAGTFGGKAQDNDRDDQDDARVGTAAAADDDEDTHEKLINFDKGQEDDAGEGLLVILRDRFVWFAAMVVCSSILILPPWLRDAVMILTPAYIVGVLLSNVLVFHI